MSKLGFVGLGAPRNLDGDGSGHKFLASRVDGALGCAS